MNPITYTIVVKTGIVRFENWDRDRREYFTSIGSFTRPQYFCPCTFCEGMHRQQAEAFSAVKKALERMHVI